MKTLILTALLCLSGAAHADYKVYEPYKAPDYSKPYGHKVYPDGTCIGAMINGVCNGTPSPRARIEQGVTNKRCYGEMINGRCTGPMF